MTRKKENLQELRILELVYFTLFLVGLFLNIGYLFREAWLPMGLNALVMAFALSWYGLLKKREKAAA